MSARISSQFMRASQRGLSITTTTDNNNNQQACQNVASPFVPLEGSLGRRSNKWEPLQLPHPVVHHLHQGRASG